MFRLLFTSSSSACFELDNKNQYFSPAPYTLYLNGEKVRRGNTNVFSLFGLKSDTEYNVEVRMKRKRETLIFRTRKERFAINVKDFGAKGDGKADDTKAIRAALDFLPEGGRLFFPKGKYLTFPQAIRSHMTIEFAEGAVLLGSPERARYQIVPGEVHDVEGGDDLIFGAFEGEIREMYQALLSAAYAEDITIIGPGTVDGNAGAGDFWTKFQEFKTARPRLFFFSNCKDINIHGIHACNSASWQFHPFFSERVSFYDISISAPKNSPNTDAIDPESCDVVNIIGCRFSVGDDCIAIKSGKMDLGMRFRKPADHHTIRNCLMEFGHGAVTLGSESSAGIRNLTVEQCYFRQTDRGLRIKTRRGRGKLSDISGVVFDNIRMEGVKTPVVINMWYNCCDPDRFSEYVWSREHLPVDDRTPHLGSFHFYNLECTGAEVAACYIDGLPEMPIDEVCFKNVSISFAPDAKPGVPAMQNFAEERCRLGLFMENVRNIRIENVSLHGVTGDSVIAPHHEEMVIDGLETDATRIKAYVKRLIRESTPERTIWNVEKLRKGEPTNWNYIDGCMMTALLSFAEITGDRSCFDFTESFIDSFIGEDGTIRTYEKDKFSLDDVNEGRVLFELYRKTGKEKYRLAAEKQREQLREQPRTYESNFWHKAIYPDQVWLDGIYMAQPFLTLYEKYFGNGDYSDTVRQIETVHQRMFCAEKGLYFHGYDASRSIFWADPETGCSKGFWLRAMGWFSVALADLLEILPEGGYRDRLVPIFTELMAGISKYADSETGMYYQVVDQGGREGNYLETSGSSMIAYAMLKGARLGVLDKEYAVQGEKTFNGIVNRYLSFKGKELNLGGICLVAGLGPAEKPQRDGTYAYYISEPIVENDAKGVAPFLLCYTEILRLQDQNSGSSPDPEPAG